jgi:hypothetical protein
MNGQSRTELQRDGWVGQIRFAKLRDSAEALRDGVRMDVQHACRLVSIVVAGEVGTQRVD